mmetsp:Transcript_59476/g.181519  ORF Transcript_59476/g.181519 Transcript_59476/m.181519 type:complete len:269 (+) Transcript_59476:109-915(+)
MPVQMQRLFLASKARSGAPSCLSISISLKPPDPGKGAEGVGEEGRSPLDGDAAEARPLDHAADPAWCPMIASAAAPMRSSKPLANLPTQASGGPPADAASTAPRKTARLHVSPDARMLARIASTYLSVEESAVAALYNWCTGPANAPGNAQVMAAISNIGLSGLSFIMSWDNCVRKSFKGISMCCLTSSRVSITAAFPERFSALAAPIAERRASSSEAPSKTASKIREAAKPNATALSLFWCTRIHSATFAAHSGLPAYITVTGTTFM